MRSYEEMVDDTMIRIKNSTNITNDGATSVTRNIVESIVSEIDIMNYEIDTVKSAINPESAVGEDLDNLYKIFQIYRKPATCTRGVVTFYVSNTNNTNIIIPKGTIVSTIIENDNFIEFKTTADAILRADTLEVDVDIIAIEPGYNNIAPNVISVMPQPVPLIEGVRNKSTVTGGANIEGDDAYLSRAQSSIQALGGGTISAIVGSIKSIPEVVDAVPKDMNRGVGTLDVIVTTSSMPTSADIIKIIEQKIRDNKSAGINVQYVAPTIIKQDIKITLDNVDSIQVDIAKQSILEYTQKLQLGESFIISQMESKIISSINDSNIDVHTILPANNIDVEDTQIIRINTVIINGVKVYG